jgi:DNA-binding CsgD family transcriptional regulator
VKHPITLLYHNPIERERLLARLNRLATLRITPMRFSACPAPDGELCVCWCADLPAALSAKEAVGESLLIIHPGHCDQLFTLLEDAQCATCPLFESDEVLEAKIERLTRPEAYAEESAETAIYLTARERDVVRLLVSGLDTAQIASHLGIKATTVVAHKKHIFLKSGVKTTAQLVAWALIRSRPDGERGGRG